MPRKITTFLFGARPAQVCTLEMDFDEEHDSIIFKFVCGKNTHAELAVSLPRIFKKIEYMGLSGEEFVARSTAHVRVDWRRPGVASWRSCIGLRSGCVLTRLLIVC